MTIDIIHVPTTEKPFLVINKPKGLPSAPLSSEDKDNALAQALEAFPELRKVQGKKEIEYGLLHRLDTATDGLIVIAATKECYDFLCEEQRQGRFIKYYQAQCKLISDNAERLGGFPPDIPTPNSSLAALSDSFSVSSYFRPYGQGRKEVRPVTEKSGKAALTKLGKTKLYTTQISIINKDPVAGKVFVECHISEGYRHQVRCHLAWTGLPVIADELYNSDYKYSDKKKAEKLLFSASKISFEYPRGVLNCYKRSK